ncbi:hypothetical protein PXD56_01090 [Maribacter sp. SA7]|uniref:hypothetical protein n=1 Tax=Maribacter zhoushanensis TaxID=3030012 RepID=UPI0023EC4CFD|nr:hypothetical protein [Maribacter zhoushanensis]MDF4201528.1 hypothetical protein [Maribacter zhoushanensis]
MKYLLSCFLIFCLCLTSCTSQKKLQTETPFEIGNATCQKYTGGREESGSGTELRIPVSLLENSDIELNEVYFRGKQVKAVVNTVDNQKMILVRIPNNNPESSETLKLALNTDEAVISYNENGEVKYAKVDGIKQKQPLIYKGAPKN